MNKLICLFVLTGLCSACTWVKVNDDGKDVAVSNMANVQGCQKVRTVNVKVTDNLGPLDRSADKVSTELATMARNEAVNFDGDTVVPVTEVKDGAQSFAVYKCK